ncbi:MAG: TIGR04086 family membrane protein [Oscillospiraceae bacterium]
MAKSNLNRGVKALTPAKEFAMQCAASSAASVVVAAILFAVCAVVITKVDLPRQLLQPISTVLTACSTLLSTFFMGKKRRKNGLVLGISVGGAVFFVVLLLFAIFGDKQITSQLLFKLLALLSAGGVGGIIGVSHKNTVKI